MQAWLPDLSQARLPTALMYLLSYLMPPTTLMYLMSYLMSICIYHKSINQYGRLRKCRAVGSMIVISIPNSHHANSDPENVNFTGGTGIHFELRCDESLNTRVGGASQ